MNLYMWLKKGIELNTYKWREVKQMKSKYKIEDCMKAGMMLYYSLNKMLLGGNWIEAG